MPRGKGKRAGKVIDAVPRIVARLKAEERARKEWRRESLRRMAEEFGMTYETARRTYGRMCDELWPPVRIEIGKRGSGGRRAGRRGS